MDTKDIYDVLAIAYLFVLPIGGGMFLFHSVQMVRNAKGGAPRFSPSLLWNPLNLAFLPQWLTEQGLLHRKRAFQWFAVAFGHGIFLACLGWALGIGYVTRSQPPS